MDPETLYEREKDLESQANMETTLDDPDNAHELKGRFENGISRMKTRVWSRRCAYPKDCDFRVSNSKVKLNFKSPNFRNYFPKSPNNQHQPLHEINNISAPPSLIINSVRGKVSNTFNTTFDRFFKVPPSWLLRYWQKSREAKVGLHHKWRGAMCNKTSYDS